MREIYIHVGYPKCASTFLQQEVFPKLDGVNFLYKYMNNKYKIDHVLWASFGKLEEGKNLISSELLSGNQLIYHKYCSGLEMLDRLKRLYPNAKIILIERNKEDWLKSLYQQHRADGGTAIHFNGYQDWYDNHLDHNILHFDEYRKKLYNTFDDVCFIKFEDFKKNNEKYIKKICDFIGVDVPVYEKKIRKPRLKEKHLKVSYFFGKLGLSKFNRDYVLGLLRRINQ